MTKTNQEVYCVVVDAGAEHEADCVYSIWQTHEQAAAEIKRLTTQNVEPGCHGGTWFVVPYTLGTSRDLWIAP